MKKPNKALFLSAVICGILMTGCGTERFAEKAEQTQKVTDTGADSEHSLYEDDDIHRKTEKNEPDVIDRAESAVTEIVSDAKEKLDDIKKDARS